MDKHTVKIFYSEEDEGYVAKIPELPGCSAFGKTRERALKEIEVALRLRLKVEHDKDKQKLEGK